MTIKKDVLGEERERERGRGVKSTTEGGGGGGGGMGRENIIREENMAQGGSNYQREVTGETC